MKKYFLLIFSIFIIASLISCRGPEGPVGPSGYDGADANLHTYFVNVKSNNWIKKTDSYNTWTAKLKFPEITKDVIDNGVVLCYVGASDGSNNWLLLPYTISYQEQNGQVFSESIYFWNYIGGIDLQFQSTQQNGPGPYPNDDYKFVIMSKTYYYSIIKNNDISTYSKLESALKSFSWKNNSK